MRQTIACLVSAVIGGMVAFVLLEDRHIAPLEAQVQGPRFPGLDGQPTPRRGAAEPDDGLLPDERVNVAIYEQTNKSVVHITSRATRVDNFFFLESQEGAGSGSVIDKSGHVLTNYHVIEGAREVNVGLYDGSSYSATLVGADPISDIAILKIDAPPELLHPLAFGDSTKLKVGMKVFAIGNPFGLERTMATGIISSLNRTLQLRGDRSVRSIIQIDASVNPGNSGGPLLDSRGRLIGITTAIASKNGQSAGVGFAIP
ncbi:MAG TPA: trypsin-like peptidase domain-containing protein, partial [Planctomycetaceae bacterium]|nr:trypsin-like peptidase domain-containing protein [Planctomycetaceae bacterium]